MKMLAPVLATLALASNAFAAPGDREVVVDKLPATIEEFIALRDKLAVTPHGGAVMDVLASILYTQNQALGLQAITVATDMKWLEADKSGKGFKGFIPWNAEQGRLKERLLYGREYVARSYVQGTSPENGYTIPAGPLKFKIREQANSVIDPNNIKLFVFCTGADSPRPMALKKNDKGLWKAYEWSSLQVGPRAPVSTQKDDL
jgi:hypothetical protein